jgi:1-acyl-sn-glycerol-3-phosphate acyltransferase
MIYLGDFFRKLTPWWMKYYHRLELKGLENLPKSGSAILAGNHGGGFDYDNFGLMTAFETLPLASEYRRRVWLLYDDRSVTPKNLWTSWVRKFTPIPVSLTNGGIPYRLLDKVVNKGDWIAIMPEGHSAAIYEGYRLWKFFPGVIRLHLRYKIPIIPTANIGFMTAVQKIGQVYHPDRVPAFTNQIYLPLIFPTKIIIDFGPPISFPEYFDCELDKPTLFNLAAEVRKRVRIQIQKYFPGASWKYPYGHNHSTPFFARNYDT